MSLLSAFDAQTHLYNNLLPLGVIDPTDLPDTTLPDIPSLSGTANLPQPPTTEYQPGTVLISFHPYVSANDTRETLQQHNLYLSCSKCGRSETISIRVVSGDVQAQLDALKASLLILRVYVPSPLRIRLSLALAMILIRYRKTRLSPTLALFPVLKSILFRRTRYYRLLMCLSARKATGLRFWHFNAAFGTLSRIIFTLPSVVVEWVYKPPLCVAHPNRQRRDIALPNLRSLVTNGD